MATAWTLMAFLLLWRRQPVWPYFFGAALLFVTSGLFFPNILAPVERLWMKLTLTFSRAMTAFFLTLIFFLVVTPIGLIMRILRRDPFRRFSDRHSQSYWYPTDPDGPVSRPEKPY